MKFNIYHPSDGSMNHDCTIGFIYGRIGTVEAKSLEEAFMLSQNDFNEDYSKLRVRSTSVGDLIQEENGQCHFIKGTSFDKVNASELFGKYLITCENDTNEALTSICIGHDIAPDPDDETIDIDLKCKYCGKPIVQTGAWGMDCEDNCVGKLTGNILNPDDQLSAFETESPE